MKLKNKQTGENYETTMPIVFNIKTSGGGEHTVSCESITELNEKWEDYEEPKTFFSIYYDGTISEFKDGDDEQIRDMKAIGNYFESEEEAEKAVEKLKAWKRLKDKGFRFTLTPGVGSLDTTPGKFQIEINADMPAKWFCCDAVQKDLDDCFGGEE